MGEDKRRECVWNWEKKVEESLRLNLSPVLDEIITSKFQNFLSISSRTLLPLILS